MQGATEDTDIETYDIYLLPPNEDPETCASWLRMRNREGRYQLMFEEWVTEGPFIITPRISFEVRLQLNSGFRHALNTPHMQHRACHEVPDGMYEV